MRLIDETELKEWVENWFYQHKYYHPYSKSNSIPCSELYDILERLPTIDAVEVKHGEWKFIGDSEEPQDGVFMCSVCGGFLYDALIDDCKYCPHCGAKMDGERRDPCSSQAS